MALHLIHQQAVQLDSRARTPRIPVKWDFPAKVALVTRLAKAPAIHQAKVPVIQELTRAPVVLIQANPVSVYHLPIRANLALAGLRLIQANQLTVAARTQAPTQEAILDNKFRARLSTNQPPTLLKVSLSQATTAPMREVMVESIQIQDTVLAPLLATAQATWALMLSL